MVGCGRMGAFTSEAVRRFAPRCWFPLSHAEAIQLHPELQLEALCDANQQALEHARAAYRVARGFADYRRLIEEVQPLLVCVATRTPGRAEIIRFAAERGTRALHVEKPLCNSVQELEALDAILARDDLFVTYGAIRRFFRIYELARSLAFSGAYGPLQEIRVNMGTGTLYWTHPHSVDLILFVAGARRIDSVQARLAQVVRADGGVEILSDPVVESATIFFEGDLSGHISRAPGADLILSCADGEITVANDGEAIHLSMREGDNPYPVRSRHATPEDGPELQGTFAPLTQLVHCLRGDREAAQSNAAVRRHIVEGQRILFAMVQSHLERSRLVTTQEVDPRMSVLGKTAERFA